ncbi:tripartite tricarboxylate transporter substrate binding protein [Variovorax sp. KK3]|uniref:Bug family tripartite tricarboxylate transporter substrate binding protein n=1 Tax=Variovorax sp. KK3 TaxID=1855728 RepID=UPI00097C162A|nr:tripartite tricarboxylate transporter substrate binding protein [Variovorax sp. KK3]
MKIPRRSVLVAGAALCLPSFAQGSPYPTKPVKFVVPFAPGGGSDTMARLVAQKLNEQHGYTIVVDNKPGAGGNLGAEAALREPADGYTLLVISGSYAGNAVLSKPAFDPISAIQPIVQFTREPSVLAVDHESPFRSLKDLVAKARKEPGAVAYGTSGVGGLAHLSTEYFASVAGVQLTHVPYKGTSAALVDLAAGQIQLMFGGTTSVAPLAKGGKVRVLAVAAPGRLASMPGVPTFAEEGLSAFRADLWHGLVAARATPPEIVAKLNADVNAVLRSADMAKRLASDDVQPGGGTPQQFADLIRGDMERWRMIVQQANIRLN